MQDFTSIDRIAINGGIMLGVGQPVDSSGKAIPRTGLQLEESRQFGRWSHPLYLCTTALKASIQTTRFRLNGTSALRNLEVLKVSPKVYKSEKDVPIWAMEKSSMQMGQVNPIWGLVSEEYADSEHLETIQAETFYLPGGPLYTFQQDMSSSDAVAGAKAPAKALALVWGATQAEYSATDNSDGTTKLPSYSGETSGLLAWRWQELSRNASLASYIPGLIWTDIMANAVIGSKGLVSHGNSSNSTLFPVTDYTASVRFDFRYGIPAFLFLGLFCILGLAALFILPVKGFNLRTLRNLLNHTSAGRVALTERYADTVSRGLSTKAWRRKVGHERMLVSKRELMRGDSADNSNETNGTQPVEDSEEKTSSHSQTAEQHDQAEVTSQAQEDSEDGMNANDGMLRTFYRA
jgi:hypothetical protein